MRCVPEIFDSRFIQSVLYVGANKFRQCHLPDFINAGIAVTILEPFCDNVVALLKMGHHVLLGDVRACSVMFYPKQFDATFWWHGPEHIPKTQLAGTLQAIEYATRKLVVLGAPWGESKQGTDYGNIYETHIDDMEPGYFLDKDYNTEVIGQRHAAPMQNNIIAWKWLIKKQAARVTK